MGEGLHRDYFSPPPAAENFLPFAASNAEAAAAAEVLRKAASSTEASAAAEVLRQAAADGILRSTENLSSALDGRGEEDNTGNHYVDGNKDVDGNQYDRVLTSSPVPERRVCNRGVVTNVCYSCPPDNKFAVIDDLLSDALLEDSPESEVSIGSSFELLDEDEEVL